MRRSLCPSQIKRDDLKIDNTKKNLLGKTNKHDDKDEIYQDEIVIKRMPMFNFLEVPEALCKQFKVPSGCVITQESIELRKIKSLGGNRHFRRIQPHDLNGSLPKCPSQSSQENSDSVEGDEEDMVGVCQSTIPPHEPLILWTDPNDDTHKIQVIPELACKLRPHQREGVQFLFECTMGLRGFDGEGCILADDMGLGKTLMSITILWTLMNQGFHKDEPAARKVVVVCPTSLVGNWDNEIRKWIGDHCPTFPVKSDPKKIIQNFINHRGKGVLIVSYETQRRFSKMFESSKKHLNTPPCCGLLICDEAHKLKNAESGLSQSLNAMPVKKRILLSGTPMQNELTEFYNMVNFCNPGVIGTVNEFRKKYERPILLSRELDATPSQINIAQMLQKELSTIVNEFILKRGNILNAQHLPSKLVQFVCCRLSPTQLSVYDAILSSKEVRHIKEGKQTDTLGTLRQLINICSHPKLVLESYINRSQNKENPLDEEGRSFLDMLIKLGVGNSGGGSNVRGSSSSSSSSSGNKYGIQNQASSVRAGSTRSGGSSSSSGGGGSRSFPGLDSNNSDWVDAEMSGKLYVLFRMMQTLRALKQGERIVIVSNYTQTLDLIEKLCGQNQWPFLRLDGSTTATTRTKLVDKFNDPYSGQFAFLLSSKAGGCGINLIGGSRLVLFDPDWNPASDKQAAGRIWREGQKRRCYIYRFMSTNTVEEKIIQRQLSKEGLQNIVDNRDQVNVFSTDELKRLFIRREEDTPSDTHDTLRCQRCMNVFSLTSEQSKLMAMERNKLIPSITELCNKFVMEFSQYIQEAFQTAQIDKAFEDFITLQEQLNNGTYTTLPQFSRKLREIVSGIEREIIEEGYQHIFGEGITLSSEFVDRWSLMVPQLTALSKAHIKSLYPSTSRQQCKRKKGHITLTQIQGGGDISGETINDCEESSGGYEYVKQEGCPEESDFNKWSHHTTVHTCDDEVLKLAMADDSTVSFVFGLEVNWSLLQLREAEMKEINEQRRLQAQKDLYELNQKRLMQKQKQLHGEDLEGDMENSDIHDGKVEGDIDKENNMNIINTNKKNISKKGKKKNVKITDDNHDDDDNTMIDIDVIDVTSPFNKRRKKRDNSKNSDVVVVVTDSLLTCKGKNSTSPKTRSNKNKLRKKVINDDDDDDDDDMNDASMHVEDFINDDEGNEDQIEDNLGNCDELNDFDDRVSDSDDDLHVNDDYNNHINQRKAITPVKKSKITSKEIQSSKETPSNQNMKKKRHVLESDSDSEDDIHVNDNSNSHCHKDKQVRYTDIHAASAVVNSIKASLLGSHMSTDAYVDMLDQDDDDDDDDKENNSSLVNQLSSKQVHHVRMNKSKLTTMIDSDDEEEDKENSRSLINTTPYTTTATTTTMKTPVTATFPMSSTTNTSPKNNNNDNNNNNRMKVKNIISLDDDNSDSD